MMRTYRHDPETHKITVHERGSSPKLLCYMESGTEHLPVGAANKILRNAHHEDLRIAARYFADFASKVLAGKSPLEHWEITMDEIDTWLAERREEERRAAFIKATSHFC